MTNLTQTCILAVLIVVCIGTLPAVVYPLTDGTCLAKKTLALTSVAWSGGALMVAATCIAICNSAITCALWLLGSFVLLASLDTFLLVAINVTFIDCYTNHEMQTINAVGSVALFVGWTAIVIANCQRTQPRADSTQPSAPA